MDIDGELYIITVVEDVSVAANACDELEESERKYRSLIEFFPEGVLLSEIRYRHPGEFGRVEIAWCNDRHRDYRAGLDLARLAIETAGIECEIRVAESGEKALAISAEFANGADVWAPFLVLLDLNLPTMTGHQVQKHLKEDETLSRIPVIVLSSSAAAEDVELSYDLSVNSYVQKPIDMPGFVEVAKSIAVFWLTMAKLPELAR